MIGSVDMVVAPVAMTYNRTHVINFLSQITVDKASFFIKKGLLLEGLDIGVFGRPFNHMTWAALIVLSILFAFGIVIIWKIDNHSTVFLTIFIKAIFSSFQTYLGNGNFALLINNLKSSKILVLTALMMGNGVWMAYQGKLLSELIVPKVTKPFKDFETLLESKYR